MVLNNLEILEKAQALDLFSKNNMKLPVRVNFFLQKNIRLILDAAYEIEQTKMSIAAQYGTLNEAKNGYDISPENRKIVEQELADLFNLEQDIPIHILKLENFEGLEFTYQQMSAIMYMIEE